MISPYSRSPLMALPALAVLLSGCVVGPDYRPPVLPEERSLANAADPVSADAPAADWWSLYADPALDRHVAAALAANTDLRGARANLAAAEAALQGARGARLPAATVSAADSIGRSPAATGSDPSPSAFISLTAGGSLDLDLFGKTRRLIEAARADTEAARAATDQLHVVVAAAVVRSYLDVCAGTAALAVAHRALDTAAGVRSRTERLERLGGVARFDVERARALEAQSGSTIPPLEAARRMAFLELAALEGRSEVEPLRCEHAPSLSGGSLPVGTASALLKRRPDVRQAERRLAGETARIGAATADLYPAISLTASLQTGGERFSQLTLPSALSYGVGPQLTWGFPRPDVRARVGQARASAAGALAAFDGAVLTALKESREAVAIWSAERSRNTALVDARDTSRRVFKIAEARNRAGGLSFLDLLQAESGLIAAEQALAASDQTLAEDAVAVFRALGVGA